VLGRTPALSSAQAAAISAFLQPADESIPWPMLMAAAVGIRNPPVPALGGDRHHSSPAVISTILPISIGSTEHSLPTSRV